MEFSFFNTHQDAGNLPAGRQVRLMRSLDYRSGSVRLYDFENQNQILTDLKKLS
jgi:hypothetical protein